MAENFSTSSATQGAAENNDLLPEVKPVGHNVLDSDALDPSAAPKNENSVAAPGPGKTWDEEFIKDVVNKTVDEVIQNSGYSHDATNVWVNQIVEIVVRALVKVDRDNKYIGKLSQPQSSCIPICFTVSSPYYITNRYFHFISIHSYSYLYDRSEPTSGNEVSNLMLLEFTDR